MIKYILISIGIIGLLASCASSTQKIDTKKHKKSVKKAKIVPVKVAKDKKTKKAYTSIEAVGYGNTKDEALKNAFSTAVSEYIGVIVDSKTIIKNGKLIEDKILTFSNGFIDNYKTISSKEQLGLWEIKILASIKEQNLLENVKKINITPIDIKGSEARYAKLVSQIKTKFEAEDMIVNLVKEYGDSYIYKYLDIKIDDVFINEEQATRKYVPIDIKYSIYFNYERYSRIISRFEKLFTGIGGKLINKNSYYNSASSRYISSSSRQGIVGDRLPISSLIIIKQNREKKLVYEVFKFPKSYNVIYPFQNGATCSQYNVDEKRIKIFKTKEVLDEIMEPYLVIKDSNNKNIITPIQLKFYLNSEAFNIFHELFYSELSYRCSGYRSRGGRMVIAPPRIHENIQSGGKKMPNSSNVALYSSTIHIKFNVNDIKKMKQIKIKWNNNEE